MTSLNTKQRNDMCLLSPIVGILFFIILYITATLFYPGGSNTNKTYKGFDWLNNYWCDLIAYIAKNGELNDARPIALTAMFILCSSLILFWVYLPKLFPFYKYNHIIRFTGICSMIVSFFLFTGLHDMVIDVAGFLGIVALSGTFIGLYKNNMRWLFAYGLFCLMVMLFNYFIYTSGHFIFLLPSIQKGTFVLFLFWICLINIQIYRNNKNIH